MARTKKLVAEVCDWTLSESEMVYDTECGNMFQLNDGTPADNEMAFCPYCGRRLRAVAPQEPT